MVKFLILKIDHPNCFLGQDLTIFEEVNAICNQIKSSNTKILPCSEVVLQKIYLADLYTEVVRIRVLSATNSNTYKCLLIDHGKIEEIRKQKIYNMPLNQLDMDPAVKMIKIPGIRPAGMADVLQGPNITVQLSESDKWTPASYKFVARIFEDHQVVHVNYLKKLTKDKLLSDVNVVYLNQRANLKELLLTERYAFLEKEQEVHSSEKRDAATENGSVDHARDSPVGNDDAQSVTTSDSFENESISAVIGQMKEDDKSNVIAQSYTTAMKKCTISDSYTQSPSRQGSLDELSLSILQLKVKCWFVSKSVETDDNNHRITNYKYLDTIRPIVSYRNEQIFANFLKDAMIAYDTKLLLLIQAYMIPTILRGVNMVAIAPSRKGKSMGMLMPVLQTIATKPVLPSRSYNPLAVILCSSWKKVKDLASSAERFVKFIPESGKIHKPRIVAAYAGSMKKMTMIPILQGCDILIITPTCLLSWLKQHEFFKLNELEMFCLDDAENIIAEHLEILKEILIFKRTGAIDKGSEPGQFITATNWTSGLESYVKHEMGGVFSIAVNDPLELAVIERMQQKIIEYDDIEGELYQKLVAYLELIESSIKRTIIFASNDYEIVSVYKYLMQKARVDLKLMTGSMSPEELNLMVKEWNQYRGYVNMPILLISDEALRTSDVSIFNADIIIHVDINELSFGSRLNFLRDKYSQLSFLKSKDTTTAQDTSKKCNSFIFICPKTINLLTANFLYKFLGRCSTERPGWLQEKAVDCILNKEKSKGFNEICPRIKAFGECKLPGCGKRHMVMSEVDKPLLPNKGHIQFRLLYLDSPSHFYVRISEFHTTCETATPYKSQYLILKMKMSNYFSVPQNIHGVNLRIVQPGLIAAIKTKDLLERVIVTRMKSNKSGYVLVKLIDKGSEMVVEQADLLHLPRELSEIPAQAIEIYVTGIKPIDNDEYYNEESCVFAKEFLDDKDLYAVIKLCIGSTLWIDAVTQRIYHELTKVTVFDKNLSVTMLDKNLVDKNVHHVDKLVRLCTGKIDIWKQDIHENLLKPVVIMRKFSYSNAAIVFESLPVIGDDCELETECVLSNIISPNCMFLNNKKTMKSAKAIQNEILTLIDSIETLAVKDIKIGVRVLYLKDGHWQRGYIINVDTNIGIFSLDWGTIETFSLGDGHLKKLPFEYQDLPYQAILCGLYFCNHAVNSYYSSDVVSVIKHYATEGSEKKKPTLVIRAYDMETVNSKMFSYDCANDIPDMDLFTSMQRYSVTVSNETVRKADQMLHYLLIRNQNVLPSLGFVHEVLPESHPFASRLVRNGSIPHLAADLLCTSDHDKRARIAQTIERIIDKKKEMFISSGSISGNISSVLHAMSILMHFVNDRSIFMCVYRSLNTLLYLAYEKKYEIANSLSKEGFSIRYITSILLDYTSTIFHMFRHLDISVRSNQIDQCRVMLDNFRMMLLDPPVVTAFFEDNMWCVVMANCVGSLIVDENVYNLLMDILVQLVMLWENKKSLLNDILTQCCLSFHRSDSLSVWNSSLSLISCFVNLQNYSHVLRNMNFFEIVFDKFVQYYNRIGRWEEFHENSLDLLTNMWRNGSANKNDILRKRHLSTDIEHIRNANIDKTALSVFVTDILLDESSVVPNGDNSTNCNAGKFAPDPDALDWIEGREISTKKYRKSYRRIYCTSDTDSSSEENPNSESDSDSSDVAVTPFLDSHGNPADEDNVACFEKA